MTSFKIDQDDFENLMISYDDRSLLQLKNKQQNQIQQLKIKLQEKRKQADTICQEQKEQRKTYAYDTMRVNKKIIDQHEEICQLKNQVQSKEKQAIKYEDSIKELQNQNKKLRNDLDAQISQMKKVQLKRIEYEDSQNQLKQATRQIMGLKQLVANLNFQNEDMATELKQKSLNLDQVKQQLTNNLAQINKLKQGNQLTSLRLNQVQSEKQASQKRLQDITEQIRRLCYLNKDGIGKKLRNFSRMGVQRESSDSDLKGKQAGQCLLGLQSFIAELEEQTNRTNKQNQALAVQSSSLMGINRALSEQIQISRQQNHQVKKHRQILWQLNGQMQAKIEHLTYQVQKKILFFQRISKSVEIFIKTKTMTNHLT